MAAINTRILADPTTCRTGADYLKRLADADHEAATSAHQARSTAESGWRGEASAAFQELVRANARDIDELVRVTRRTQRALNSFAENIDTCHARMDQARRTATEGGVTVTGWWIHEPRGADTAMPDDGKGTTSLPGLDPKHDVRERKEEQLQAWRDAEGMVSWARRLERTAHEELNSVLTDTNSVIASLRKSAMWIGNIASGVGAVHGAATKLQSMADEQLRFVREFNAAAADSGLSAERRQTRIAQLMHNYGITQRQATSNARALGNLGNTKLGNTVFNPLTKTLGGAKDGMLGNMGRAVGISCLVVTTIDSGRQIIFQGKPVGKTISVNFTGFGLGAVGTGLVGAGFSAIGMATAPATITAFGVGATTTWAYGYFQDNTLADFRHDSGEAAADVLDQHSKTQERINEIERKHPGSMSKW